MRLLKAADTVRPEELLTAIQAAIAPQLMGGRP